jgi:hypothetical protein
MDKKEKIQKMVTKLKLIYDMITNKSVEYEYGSLKEDKKDYKYKNEVIKDDWEEILKGNDYY